MVQRNAQVIITSVKSGKLFYMENNKSKGSKMSLSLSLLHT